MRFRWHEGAPNQLREVGVRVKCMRNFKIWVASRSLDAAAAYAARGRLTASCRMCGWPINGPPPSSEHKLRGREVPHEAVAEHRKLLITQILARHERSLDAREGIASGAGRVNHDVKRLRAIRTRVVRGMPGALREVAACSRSVIALRSAIPPW